MGKRALILTDIQNDFLPGGALAVRKGDEVIPVANRLIGAFEVVVATQDWHPPDHCSFAASHEGRQVGEVIEVAGLPQVLWPIHCVAESYGAELSDALQLPERYCALQKGWRSSIDSYSVFFDNGHRHSTGLTERLREEGVDTVYLVGLTTEYCVKFSALDAASLGFETYVVVDGCRAVNLDPRDEERALQEMRDAGVHLILSNNV